MRGFDVVTLGMAGEDLTVVNGIHDHEVKGEDSGEDLADEVVLDFPDMPLGVFKGITGELKVLEYLIGRFLDDEWYMMFDDLLEAYHMIYSEQSFFCEEGWILHGALVGAVIDYIVGPINEFGDVVGYCFLEVKSTSDPNRRIFSLQRGQDQWLKNVDTILAVVRLSDIPKVDFQHWAEYVENSVIEFYMREEYLVYGQNVVLKEPIRERSYAET